MRVFNRLPGVAANILLVVGLIALWITFAPAKLGGQVSYLIVNGTSMEPTFHGGDLVIVNKSPIYLVGDIVSYKDADMGAYVIHRIIETEQNHIIMKGDNNSWIDEYQPTHSEIVGKLWIHLPKMGAAIEWVRSPINMALTTGLLGGLVMVNLTMQKSNKNNKKKNKAAGTFELSLYLFGSLALVFIALCVFAFTRPLMRTADNIQYEQTGFFSYSADGSSGVYDTGAVRSGEPVFTKLTCTLNLDFVGFINTLKGEPLENISGTQQFFATILDEQSGWQRTYPLSSATNFIENAYKSSTILDLCQVEAIVSAMEKETGFRLSPTYKLVILAHISASGIISGQPFTNIFGPKLTFKFDSLHFYVEGDPSQTNPMQTIQQGSLTNPNLTNNTVPFFGLTPEVRGLRILSVIGILISLGGLLALWRFYYRASKRSLDTIIHIKYGSLVMDVYDQGLKMLSPVIEVASIDDLAMLAERQNAMILHLTGEHAHYYIVQINGTTYRFVTGKDRVTDST